MGCWVCHRDEEYLGTDGRCMDCVMRAARERYQPPAWDDPRWIEADPAEIQAFLGGTSDLSGNGSVPIINLPSEAGLPDLVTLNQIAGIVKRKKRSLEKYKAKGSLPAPVVEGGGGKPDFWDWPAVRPWLEAEFKMKLPKMFPGNL